MHQKSYGLGAFIRKWALKVVSLWGLGHIAIIHHRKAALTELLLVRGDLQIKPKGFTVAKRFNPNGHQDIEALGGFQAR